MATIIVEARVRFIEAGALESETCESLADIASQSLAEAMKSAAERWRDNKIDPFLSQQLTVEIELV